MAIMDVFVGVPQSKYAGIAILMALVGVSIAILFGRDTLPLSQKFAFVILIFLVSLPSVLLTLFQLTCLVTGDKKGDAWWCGWYSWLVSALLILYSVLVVTVAVLTLASGGKILDQITAENFEAANKLAKEQFAQNPKYEQPLTGSIDGTSSLPAPVTAPPSVPSGQVLLDLSVQKPAPVVTAAGVQAYDSAAENFSSLEHFADAPAVAAQAPVPAAPMPEKKPDAPAAPAMPAVPAAPVAPAMPAVPAKFTDAPSNKKY
jgi:uncharacterized membrane protein